MELFERIRLEYEFGVGTIQGVSRKLRVHRRLVREAIQSAIPARRKKTERPHVKMAPAAEFIDAVLEGDRKAPRKQRHTAKRIWDRIREEVPGCTAAERTVRLYVEQRKEALGLVRRETFVPQSYDWGIEAQVDWYEADACLDGEQIKLQVFSLRSMASGAAYHRAYATLMKASGADVKVVQDSLRHANARITMEIYAQALTADKRSAQTNVVQMILPKQATLQAAGNAG
jgi:hypothetical protein